MSKLNSLIKKECHEFKIEWVIVLLISVIFVGIIPSILEQFLGNEFSSEKVRIPILFSSLTLLIPIPIIQLLTSLHRDIKQKDIWLHNPNSIYTLIGAKWLFTFFALVITSFISFLGFFFLGNELEGSFWQILLLIIYFVIVELFMYISFSILALLFFALYLQLKRYIGPFSLLIVFTLIILFFWFINEVPEKYIQIPYGKIPTNWIYEKLPTFTDSTITVDLELYLVDLIVGLLVLTICYFGASKWIEKVITR